MIAVTGYRTTIVEHLREMVDENVVRIDGTGMDKFNFDFIIPDCSRYVLAAGVLHQKSLLEQTAHEIQECLAVNMINVARVCDFIFNNIHDARVCVIGSESGFKGSYNSVYAMSKAAIHAYVSFKRVGDEQSLTCVAPPIIRDAGMTLRRNDYPEGIIDRVTVGSIDVALKVRELLYDDSLLGKTKIVRMSHER